MGLAERQAASESGAVVRDIRELPFIELTFIPNSTFKWLVPSGVRQNAKTKKPAIRRVFRGGAEILKAFSGTLSGSTTWTRTRDPVINSHLLYQLSYRGMARMLLIQKEKSSIC